MKCDECGRLLSLRELVILDEISSDPTDICFCRIARRIAELEQKLERTKVKAYYLKEDD